MTSQLNLFDPHHNELIETEQQQNLTRVTQSIGDAVLDWLRDIGAGNGFGMGELESDIGRKHNITPGSPGRIMRDLKKRKLIGYTLISRSQSLYRLDWVATNQEQALTTSVDASN